MDKEKMYFTFRDKLNQLFIENDNDCFHSPNNIQDQLEKLLSPNQFLTITNLFNGEINPSSSRNIEKVLGCSADEFTSNALYEMTIPEHLILAFEYAMITISLLNEKNIDFNSEYGYSVEFTVKVKGTFFRLERFCWIYQFKEGKPYQHLDIWTDKSQQKNNSIFVEYGFFTPNSETTQRMYRQFYKKWTKERLRFNLTERQLTIINYLIKGEKRREIAVKLNLQKTMLDEHIKKAKARINDFIEQSREQYAHIDSINNGLVNMIMNESRISEEKELMNFVKKYSLNKL